MTKGENNNLFDDSIFIDDEGNVIEKDETTNETEVKHEILTDGEILINSEGKVIDNEGNVVEKHNTAPSNETNDNLEEKPASTNSTTNSTLPPLVESLKEAGVLPDFEAKEDEEITAETLIEAIRDQIKKSEYADLTEEQKDILEIMRTGGDIGNYLKYHQKDVSSQEAFQVITEDNAEDFTRKYYKLKGLSESEITDIIDERVISGTLRERAENLKPAYDSIVKEAKKKEVERAKQEEIRRQEEAEKSINQYKELIDSTDELIKGNKLSKSVKDKVFELGTKPVETKDGQTMTALQKAYVDDPLGTEFKLNYLYLITDGFTKMDNISYSKKSKTLAIQELNERLEQEKKFSQGRKSSPRQSNNKPSILDASF